MSMGIDDIWIFACACLVAIPCTILGCFLVLRNMSMIGDAIGHAVLPGIFCAYYFYHSKATFPVLIGASLSGLAATFLIQWIHKKVKLQSDASIGISYTLFFAIGVILVSAFGAQADIDQDCILHGEIAQIPLDTLSLNDGFSLGPRQFWMLLGNTLLVVAFCLLGYRALWSTSFDEHFIKSIGIGVLFWQFSLMGMVSLTSVVSFESVGAILVIIFLVGPASTAYLIAKQLNKMIWWSILFAIHACFWGYLAAILFDGSIAGSIATTMGIQFFVVFFFLKWAQNSSNKSLDLQDYE